MNKTADKKSTEMKDAIINCFCEVSVNENTSEKQAISSQAILNKVILKFDGMVEQKRKHTARKQKNKIVDPFQIMLGLGLDKSNGIRNWCKFCASAVQADLDLKVHMTGHIKGMLMCPLCDEKPFFQSKDVYLKHLSKHEYLRETVDCTFCCTKIRVGRQYYMPHSRTHKVLRLPRCVAKCRHS